MKCGKQVSGHGVSGNESRSEEIKQGCSINKNHI